MKAATVEAFVDLRILTNAVRDHALYENVRDAVSLRLLMRAHVFAVWDFQSLLKALQRSMTCVDVPWLPTADPEARRLVNEIVLDEESDACPWGGHLSHFELYHRSMVECGADTGPIDQFVSGVKSGHSIDDALTASGTSAAVRAFVATTMKVAMSRSRHRIAAAFSYGREDIIPEMFQRLVQSLEAGNPGMWSTFQFYLDRHIRNDAEKHGPMARSLTQKLCGSDSRLNAEAVETARACLEARVALWDDIVQSIRCRS